MRDNNQKILSLKNLIASNLTPLIDSDYVLLDTPNHCNIGDNLIWQGELDYLAEYVPEKTLKYSANVINVDMQKISKGDVILFHGGGNFGDLYPECQELRKVVTDHYKENRIIILPQTVYYKDKNKLIGDSRVFNSHNDIHICVRDAESFRILQEHIDPQKLILLPDMAFCMKLRRIKHSTTGKTLYLNRVDCEANNCEIQIAEKFETKDWPTYSNSRIHNILSNVLFGLERKASTLLQHSFLSFMVDSEYGLKYRKNRQRYVSKGIKFINEYDTIYTTRLHGLILATLLKKRIIIVDNNYGKCTSYYNTWLKGFENITIYK